MTRALWDWHFGDSLAQFRSAVDRLFDTGTGEFAWRSGWESTAFPLMTLTEEPERFQLEAELPGVRMNDLEITCKDRQLTVRGERKTSGDAEESYERRERPTGSFVRTLELPAEVEAARISAALADGILHVQIPKAERARSRRIEIHVPSRTEDRPVESSLQKKE